MKLVKIKGEKIGLLVQLPTGPYAIDIAKSLGVFSAHDPLSGGIINGVLKERCGWGALVNNWSYLRKPLELLARTALTDPDDPRLTIYPLGCKPQIKDHAHGIVALEITDGADLEIYDPTGRLVMAGQLAEPVDDRIQPAASSIGENVQVIDFSAHNERRTSREQ